MQRMGGVTSRHAHDARGLQERWLACVLVCLVWVFGTLAAAQAQDVRAQVGGSVNLAVGQGKLLRFNEPVESVFVADTTVAEVQIVSPDVAYIFGLKPGVTNLIAITASEKVEASTKLRVAQDSESANEAARALQPTTTTEISIFGNRIVATGAARNVDEAVSIDNVSRTYSPPDQPPVNETTVQGSQQVNIRVRFAEVSRNELLSYGVDWEVVGSDGNFSFGMFKSGGTTSDANLGISVGGSEFKVDVLIEALKRNGIVKILAEPNLTAMTGQSANFLAGGEVPVPVPQGNDSVTVQYKSFGVSLEFTPTLIGRNRIAMHVKPEVSSLSEAGAVVVQGLTLPSFITRRADTTVEVGSGQTFAIAGLFQQRMSRNLQKFPVLGDVPIVGALFKSQRFQREETELVILITPYLVEPVSDRSLATPLDRPAKRVKRKSVGMIVK